MKKRLNILLFDLDGTLVRTGGAGVRAMNRAFRKLYRLENPLDGIAVAGNTDPKIFREVLTKKGGGRTLSQEEEKSFFDHYLGFLQEEIDLSPNYRVLPGIHEILKETSKSPDFLVGLGTGNLKEGARIKLERGRLNHYFTFGGFASDSHDRHEILKIAIQRAQERAETLLDPAQVFIIGDTPRDIEVARAMGAKVLAVATGGASFSELASCQPDHLMENLGCVAEFFSLFDGSSKISPSSPR